MIGAEIGENGGAGFTPASSTSDRMAGVKPAPPTEGSAPSFPHSLIPPLIHSFIPFFSYFRFSQAFGTGTMQMFIDLLSAESIADWIWIRVPSALKVGCR